MTNLVARFVGIACCIVIIAAILLVYALLPVEGHEWYSSNCCGQIHCRPVPCDQLVEDRDGWIYLPTRNHFYAGQVYPSQDRYCHVCIHDNGGRSLCAYIQQGS
jgi:hypothetical protein